MRDLARLAELSHVIEQAALGLCGDESPDPGAESYLSGLCEGEPEAAALALSYVLRRIEDRPSAHLDRTAAVLGRAIRRSVERA